MAKYIAQILVATLLFLGSSLASVAQDQILKDLQTDARYKMNNGNYKGAYDIYEKLLAVDGSKCSYNYEMGVCVFKGSVDKTKALPYFEKAQESWKPNIEPAELWYYLGKTYHYQGNFTFAIPSYNTCLNFLSAGKGGEELRNEILELIDQCEQGKIAVKEQTMVVLEDQDPSKPDVFKYFVDGNRYVKIENLSDKLNTEYSEYGPLFLGDNSSMIFTSRREGTGKELYYDDQYYEDIYVAYFDDGKLSNVTNLNESDVLNFSVKNTARHDATVSMSIDQNFLFLYYNNHVMELEKNESGEWSEPIELSEDVANATNQVTAATLNSENNLLLLVSNRANDTQGGRDIYYSEKNAAGKWEPMKNIGSPINTDGDESSPYMPNDSTLYFSSKGHSSIGGYDVFVSHKRNGGWTNPENLNMPINTPYDEINYRISNDRKFAYYASDRNEGYGKFDIYKITKGFDVVVDENVLAQFEGVPEDSLPTKTFLNEGSLAYEGDAGSKTGQNKIDAKEGENGSGDLTEGLVNQKGGATIGAGSEKDLAALANNKNLSLEKTGSNTISVSENFDDNPIRLSDFNQKALESSIKFNIPNSVQYRDDYSNSFIFEKVAHFGFGSTALTDYSKNVIQPVLSFLKDNPNKQFTLRLYGHTDSKGSPKQNMIISKERVENVKAYLEAEGVKAKIETKSFGESRPATTSENDKNAVFNRRVQVRVYVN